MYCKSRIGEIIGRSIKQLQFGTTVELEDVDDVVYSIFKGGAFAVLPGAVIKNSKKNAQLANKKCG